MHIPQRPRGTLAAGLSLPLAVTTLLVTACSSGSTSSPATAQTSAPAAQTSPAAASGGSARGGTATVVVTGRNSSGAYLTDAGGRALYLWVADTSGKSTCAGPCAAAWPPLTTNGAPTAGIGADARDLGAVSRSDGASQVTYHGHPLYYYAGDSGPGQTSGQGSNGFGAKWWLVAPDGTAITGSGSSTPAPASSGGAGGYGY